LSSQKLELRCSGLRAPMSKGGNNVRVVCRVRPQNKIEVRHKGVQCVTIDDGGTEIKIGNEEPHTFTFDRCFGTESTQKEVYEFAAAPVLAETMKGFNATIFAYGQTGSGKTWTMEGPNHSDDELMGLIPRTVGKMFEKIADAPEDVEFSVRVSYCEIYLEKIRDLLDEFGTKSNLQIREDPQNGIYVAGITEEYVTSCEELLSVMEDGAARRKVAATGMNEGSSRSHSVFTVVVKQRDTSTGTMLQGKLVLVDLAGSEMISKTGATGARLDEAKMINKSLSALGQVINALTDPGSSHIPYRDSKLTRMLQESIGGNSKTTLIIAASPSTYNEMETLSTCRFGARAKRITNIAKKNEQRSVEELTKLLKKAEFAIDMQQGHITALEAQLTDMRQRLGIEEPISLPSPPSAAASGEGGDEGGDAAAAVSATAAPSEGAAAAIADAEARYRQLAEQLEEAQEDARRSAQEVEQLTDLLRQKEELMDEMAVQLQEEEERVDAAEEEKREAEEAANARLEEQRLLLKQEHDYEKEELELTVETLKAENAKLAKDLEELSASGAAAKGEGGSAAGDGTPASAGGWEAERNKLLAQLREKDQKVRRPPARNAAARTPCSASTPFLRHSNSHLRADHARRLPTWRAAALVEGGAPAAEAAAACPTASARICALCSSASSSWSPCTASYCASMHRSSWRTPSTARSSGCVTSASSSSSRTRGCWLPT